MNEILKELQTNVEEMEILISNQKFSVADAQRFLKRYFNIYRKMEQLEESRDNWKKKYIKLRGVGKIKEELLDEL